MWDSIGVVTPEYRAVLWFVAKMREIVLDSEMHRLEQQKMPRLMAATSIAH